MTIVDSSSWVEALREQGDRVTKARVEKLLDAGEVAWCQIIRLELWRGVRGHLERQKLIFLESRLIMLTIDDEIWNASMKLMVKARAQGVTAPTADVLIAATAAHYGVDVEHRDQHLEQLLRIA